MNKEIDAALSEFWFMSAGIGKSRLNEKERKELIAHMESAGFVLVPAEPTEGQRNAIAYACEKQGFPSVEPDSRVVEKVYAAAIRARPR